MATFDGIRACVFDAYGTLFDVHSAVGRHRDRMGESASAISALWRQKQLEYTWLRSLMQRHVDFWQLTGDTLDYALASHAVADPVLRADLMDAYLRLDSYPEVPAVLEHLNRAGLRCAILSNGSPTMLEAAIDNAGLGEWLQAVLSIEAVGIYKPDPRVYRLAVDRLGVSTDQVCFLSSNAWDVAGALSFGFRVAWINRFGQPPERLGQTADAELRTLDELPPLLGV